LSEGWRVATGAPWRRHCARLDFRGERGGTGLALAWGAALERSGAARVMHVGRLGSCSASDRWLAASGVGGGF
jgi:hypothetical protein